MDYQNEEQVEVAAQSKCSRLYSSRHAQEHAHRIIGVLHAIADTDQDELRQKVLYEAARGVDRILVNVMDSEQYAADLNELLNQPVEDNPRGIIPMTRRDQKLPEHIRKLRERVLLLEGELGVERRRIRALGETLEMLRSATSDAADLAATIIDKLRPSAYGYKVRIPRKDIARLFEILRTGAGREND